MDKCEPHQIDLARAKLKGAQLLNVPRTAFQVCLCMVSLVACSSEHRQIPEQSVEDHYLSAKRFMLAKKYAQAESQFKVAIPAYEKSKENEIKYLDSLARLSLACSMQGRLDEAFKHIEPVIQHLKQSAPTGDDSELLVVLDELCEQFLLHAKPGSADEKDLLEKALLFDLLCHEGNHTRLVEIWSRLAMCDIAKADSNQAKQYIDKAVEMTFGKDRHSFQNNMIAVLQIHIAYVRAKKLKEASEFLQSIINKTKPFLHQESELIVYDRLGSAYAKFGDLKESIKYYEKSLSIQIKQGHDPRTRVRTMEKLALAHEASGNQAKAETLLRNGIDLLTKTEPRNSRFLFDSIQCYASYLGRQKRFAECKLWKTKAQEGIRDLIPE